MREGQSIYTYVYFIISLKFIYRFSEYHHPEIFTYELNDIERFEETTAIFCESESKLELMHTMERERERERDAHTDRGTHKHIERDRVRE